MTQFADIMAAAEAATYAAVAAPSPKPVDKEAAQLVGAFKAVATAVGKRHGITRRAAMAGLLGAYNSHTPHRWEDVYDYIAG